MNLTKPKYMMRVEFWDDERGIGNSLIVTLHYGFSFDLNDHEGVKGFDTIKEAKEGIKNSRICKCKECLNGSIMQNRANHPS
jgi:hypothetical protein